MKQKKSSFDDPQENNVSRDSLEKQMEEKYYEMQFYEEEIKKIEQRLKELDQQQEEVLFVKQSLQDLKEVQPGTEALVPVAHGIFTKATLQEPLKVRINVGAHVNVEKSVDEAIALMNNHFQELAEFREKLIHKLQKLLELSQHLEQEIVSLTTSYEKYVLKK